MISGIDISHHEGHVDWDKFFASDHKQRFVIVKATAAYDFKDSEFEANWKALGEANIIRGAYHFFHSGLDPIKQADWFLQIAGVSSFRKRTLAPILDLEKKDATWNKTQSRAGEWIKYIEKYIKRPPIIYSSPGFFAEKLTPWGGFNWTRNKYPLWLAHYGVDQPTLPEGWAKWDFWQYATDARFEGIPGACDINWFNGSLKELYALALSEPPADSRPAVPLAEWAVKADAWMAENGYDGERPAG